MADAAAYGRFSTDEQDGHSFDTQFSKIDEIATGNGDKIVKRYQDEGVSGRTADRGQFMAMFREIKAGTLKVSKIYVYKFSRFMRDPEESIFFKKRLESLGVAVVSATEQLPENGRMASFMERLIELQDKFASDTISEFVLGAMEELARRGYWTGGPPPFGYKLIEIENREGHVCKGEVVKRGDLVPDAAEAEIVQRIFDIAVRTGAGGHRIYKILCDEMGRQVQGRKGGLLGGRGVNAILTKPIYKGEFVYNAHGYKLVYDEENRSERRMIKRRYRKDADKQVRVQVEEWRIVEDDVWNAAKQNRVENTRADFGHGRKRAAYALTGFFKCSICGNSVGGHWQQNSDGSNRYHYYRCRGAMNAAGLCSNAAKVRGLELEADLINKIENVVLSPDAIRTIAENVAQILNDKYAKAADRTALIARSRELEREIQNLKQLAAKLGDIEETAAEISMRRKELSEIEKDLSESNPRKPVSADDLMAKIQPRIGRTIELIKSAADCDQLRLELRKWIDELHLEADGKIAIQWKAGAVQELIDGRLAS